MCAKAQMSEIQGVFGRQVGLLAGKDKEKEKIMAYQQKASACLSPAVDP